MLVGRNLSDELVSFKIQLFKLIYIFYLILKIMLFDYGQINAVVKDTMKEADTTGKGKLSFEDFHDVCFYYLKNYFIYFYF